MLCLISKVYICIDIIWFPLLKQMDSLYIWNIFSVSTVLSQRKSSTPSFFNIISFILQHGLTKLWKDLKRFEKIWKDLKRCKKMQKDVKRCKKNWNKKNWNVLTRGHGSEFISVLLYLQRTYLSTRLTIFYMRKEELTKCKPAMQFYFPYKQLYSEAFFPQLPL